MKTKAILISILTFLVVAVKLRFEHYNLFFPIILIFLIIVGLKKHKNPRGYRVILWILLFINTMCLMFPDKTVYKLRKNHRYFWSEEPLDVSHFRIRENVEGDTAATVHPTTVGKINKVFNYPPAILLTSDYLHSSWIDIASLKDSSENKEALKVLLEHEKLHFDIHEIYTRRAQDSLNQMIFSSYEEKYSALDYFLEISDSIQDVFDLETDHGLILENNRKWSSFIEKELNNESSIDNAQH